MYESPTSTSVCSLPAIAGHGLEEAQRFLDRHLQHFVDVLAAVADLERLAVVALALADVAGHVDVRQEVHLDLDDAVALARLAAPALHVEAEAAGVVAARARFGHCGEQLAQRREQPGVRGRVRARRAADGTLVDVDDAIDVLEPLDALAPAPGRARAVQDARARA